jgi:FMN-dependent NADH-azoreductase
MTQHILRIDASARRSGSVSRDLADRIIARIGAGATVTTRDLADGVPLIDEAWVGAPSRPPPTAPRSSAKGSPCPIRSWPSFRPPTRS